MHYNSPRDSHVTGDWRPEGAEPIPCRVAGYWNGWAEPLVTREVLERIVLPEQEQLAGDEWHTPTLRMDGDDLIYVPEPAAYSEDWLPNPETGGYPLVPAEGALERARAECEANADRIRPRDGLYSVGFAWTWYEVNADGSPKNSSPDEDPAAPTREQHDALPVARAEVIARFGLDPGAPFPPIGSWNCCALDDGTHIFPITVPTGERAPEGYSLSRTAGSVIIWRDGTYEIEVSDS